MKKILIIFVLLLLPNFAHARANYTYYISENTEIISNSNQQTATKPIKLNSNYGLSNGKCYIKIKANNKNVLRINTPKLSNNNALKLVNIMF